MRLPLVVIFSNLSYPSSYRKIANLVDPDPISIVKTFLEKYPKISMTVLVSIMLFLLLGVLELGLRIAGFEAGYKTRRPYFEEVDSVIVYDGYVADEMGIQKVNPLKVEEISRRVVDREDFSPSEWVDFRNKDRVYETWGLIHEHIELKDGHLDHEFQRFINDLKYKQSGQRPARDMAYLEFLDHPINEEGFRSIAFEELPEEEKTILLIGDSFTWGLSATQPSGSFGDCLSARGFSVYNSGIIAADAFQYQAIAEKYIPKIKPDVVIVNFFMGNDVSYYPRELKANRLMYYPTNAGNLISSPHGIYFPDAKTAYNNFETQSRIPDYRFPDSFLAKTALGSAIWRFFVGHHLVNEPFSQELMDYYAVADSARSEIPYSKGAISRIREVCEENNTEFILAVIPDSQDFDEFSPENFPEQFDGFNYFYSSDFEMADYDYRGGHFNDQGHVKYADYLEGVLGKLPLEVWG